MWPKPFWIRKQNYLLKRFHEIFTSFPVLNNVKLSNWITGSNRSLQFVESFIYNFFKNRGTHLAWFVWTFQSPQTNKQIVQNVEIRLHKADRPHCGATVFSIFIYKCAHLSFFSTALFNLGITAHAR
jgi:hypothetical protein